MSARALLFVFAACSIFVAPAFAATQSGYHRHYAGRHVYYPGYPNRVYAGGWRHRSNARGWDNTCLNAPWLPSEFACSAR